MQLQRLVLPGGSLTNFITYDENQETEQHRRSELIWFPLPCLKTSDAAELTKKSTRQTPGQAVHGVLLQGGQEPRNDISNIFPALVWIST